jgi:membrane-associated phospholipid phosphatase
MKFSSLIKLAILNIKNNKLIAALCSLLLCLCMLYPSEMQEDSGVSNNKQSDLVVQKTEHYGRFINTVLQVALPLATRDIVGLKQLVLIAITATIATHSLKRVLNDVEIMGTRLGQRPSSTRSKHNMPSGHSSLAASGAYFVCRRYGLKFALIVVPVLILTMYARVVLDAHTITAVLAGTLVGVLTTALFTTGYIWPHMSRKN